MVLDGKQCDLVATTLSNATMDLHLQFLEVWNINKVPPQVFNPIGDNRDRFIFYMQPCLHSLWVPGGRENDISTEYPRWNTTFHDFYTSIEQANPAYSFLLGTTVSVCDSKIWERPLVKMYLEGGSFVNGEPRSVLDLYNYQGRANLPVNYSGPIRVIKPFRENHTCDNSLFDEGGVLKCTSVGLEVLGQHGLLKNPIVKIVDMHEATNFACPDTSDGRHYSRGALRRQLTLLLKAMQSVPK